MHHVVNIRDLEMAERVHARGGRFQSCTLLEGEEGRPGNFFLTMARTFDDFDSPRHRHSFDQVRIQLEGDADFTRDGVMTPGMIGYFPEGVFYGPQANPAESLTVVLQFGGASRSGYLSESQFQRGIAQLRETGTFDAGVYKRPQPDGGVRSQDAYEAVWEHANGRRLEYPQSRYDRPVFMRPDAAAWIADARVRGVSRKHLGTFSEARTALSVIGLDPDVEAEVPANTVLFVLKGRGRSAGRTWERHSALYSGASASRVTADATSEILEIRLPEL